MVQVPWLGCFYPPDAAAQGKKPTPPTPAAEGLKRTLGRLGAWPWDPGSYDWEYSNQLAHGSGRGPGVEGVQAWARISPSGWIGKPTWNFLRSVLVQEGKPHEGEHAMDAKAADLIRQAAVQPPTPDENMQETVQRVIQDYCRRALANIGNWHYRQARPMQSLGDNPDGVIYSDCSEGVTAAYYWAGLETGYTVPDPNGNGYDGSGYTETLWANNPDCSSPYRVGDLALYSSNGGHVTVCIGAGDSSSSVWWSNGSEGGPYQEPLYYRSDLRGVVRPALVES
jgi:hypothetical protein